MTRSTAEIYELHPEDFEIACSVFRPLEHNLAVNAVLQGSTPGRVFVDDPYAPKTALTWVKQRIFLAGSAQDDGFNAGLRKLFAQQIAPQAVAAGKVEFILYYAPDSWDERVDAIFQGKHPLKDDRFYFELRELKHDWRTLIPPDCEIRRVDQEFLSQTHLKNLDDVIEEIHSERQSLDDFFDHGFGYCLVRDDGIASWCFSEYNSADRCEVGIVTLQSYRKRGYGTLTASAVIEHALASGIERVGWHCWKSNEPSIALAQRLGFEKKLQYPVFFARFDELENCVVHAWFCVHRLAAYKEAAEWYEKAFELGEARAGVFYDAARAWALAEAHDAAIRCLNRALDAGWTDTERLRTDPDFQNLRGTKAWQTLMDRL